MSRLLLKRGKPGVRGQIVTDIQNALGRAGHPVPTVDGVYGQDTRTKNYFFSSSNELPVSLTGEGFSEGKRMHGTSRSSKSSRPVGFGGRFPTNSIEGTPRTRAANAMPAPLLRPRHRLSKAIRPLFVTQLRIWPHGGTMSTSASGKVVDENGVGLSGLGVHLEALVVSLVKTTMNSAGQDSEIRVHVRDSVKDIQSGTRH
jgi:peptidoglycan hydrolase-like protein with peptidoglycan-binding domain